MASLPKRRIPLGANSKRISYEKRLRLALWALFLPVLALLSALMYLLHAPLATWIMFLVAALLVWAVLQAWIAEQMLRPLQTLANVVAALREEDYSFRARGAVRGDALGDLALEINALAADLQAERLTSLESAALVRRVLESIDAPVLAFDGDSILRLMNPAAVRILQVNPKVALGKPAAFLGVEHLLTVADEQVSTLRNESNAAQWLVRRSRFRQHGVPHTLILLSDVSLALREEERMAWKRIIRVLGHEINNSLTPIKSIAGSLRRMAQMSMPSSEFDRPLEVIEERAESLNHFLTAYRQLSQLPPPRRQAFALASFLDQLSTLETRLAVKIDRGPDVMIEADKDQLGQAIINLLKNAAEAAVEHHPPKSAEPACVSVGWSMTDDEALIRIRDNGLGIANPSNLFVPFYTTKQNGTGIGLALVKSIVEAHQGTITLSNLPEGGAQAELRLPLGTG